MKRNPTWNWLDCELQSHICMLTLTSMYIPNEMLPLPVLSNSWKATMNRASGAHSTDSKAKNSWKEISLFGQEKDSAVWLKDKKRKSSSNYIRVHPEITRRMMLTDWRTTSKYSNVIMKLFFSWASKFILDKSTGGFHRQVPSNGGSRGF